jgi:hypothetical protein
MNEILLNTTKFESASLDKLNKKDFPLTTELLEKNKYRATDSVTTITIKGKDSPSALAIYRDRYNDENATTKRRLFCLEVALSEHGRGLGHKLLEELKWDSDEITLGYLLGSKFFYIKEGFEESGENELKWKREIFNLD